MPGFDFNPNIQRFSAFQASQAASQPLSQRNTNPEFPGNFFGNVQEKPKFPEFALGNANDSISSSGPEEANNPQQANTRNVNQQGKPQAGKGKGGKGPPTGLKGMFAGLNGLFESDINSLSTSISSDIMSMPTELQGAFSASLSSIINNSSGSETVSSLQDLQSQVEDALEKLNNQKAAPDEINPEVSVESGSDVGVSQPSPMGGAKPVPPVVAPKGAPVAKAPVVPQTASRPPQGVSSPPPAFLRFNGRG